MSPYMIFLLLIFFNLCASTVAEPKSKYNEKGWKAASEYLTKTMDKTANPCKDFRQFVCGNFDYNVTEYNGQDIYQLYSQLRYRDILKTMQDAINNVNLNDDRSPQYAKIVRRFYDDCVHTRDEAATVNQVYELLRSTLGEFPAFQSDGQSDNESDIWYSMGQLNRKFGVDLALKVTFLGPFEYIEALKPNSNFSREEFRNQTLVAAAALQKQVNTNQLDKLLDEAEALYNEWRNAHGQEFEIFELIVSYLETTNEKLSKNTSINWDSYFRGLLPSYVQESKKFAKSNVAINDRKLLQQIGKIFSKHPKRASIMLMYGKAFDRIMAEWSQSFENTYAANAAYFGKLNATRPFLCETYILQYMSAAAARTYLEYMNINAMRWREEIQLIVNNVFASMRLLLNSISYISPASKERINRKMDAITVYPTLPSWIMNDTKLLENSESFTFNSSSSLLKKKLENEQRKFLKDVDEWFNFSLLEEIKLINSTLADFLGELKKTGRPEGPPITRIICLIVSKLKAPFDPDGPPSFLVNSVFLGCLLGLNLYLGYSAPPVFNPDYPLAVKYGSFAFVVGHELMHAFDSGGITISGPNDDKLLEKHELDVYNKQVACLIKNYDQYCYKKVGGCLNSTNAIGENIADIGGMKAVYGAYQLVKDFYPEEPPVPGLTEFTNDQLFFIAVQRVWCARNLPTQENLQEDHTTDEARITMMLRNTPHFAAAFKCPVGSPNAPVKNCDMWGDIYGTGNEH